MDMSLCLIPGSRAPIGLQEAGADLESVCLGGGGGGVKSKVGGGGEVIAHCAPVSDK